MSNLIDRIAAAEAAGNVIELAAIARQLLPKAKRAAPPDGAELFSLSHRRQLGLPAFKEPKFLNGSVGWALVTFETGEHYLVSGYPRQETDPLAVFRRNAASKWIAEASGVNEPVIGRHVDPSLVAPAITSVEPIADVEDDLELLREATVDERLARRAKGVALADLFKAVASTLTTEQRIAWFSPENLAAHRKFKRQLKIVAGTEHREAA